MLSEECINLQRDGWEYIRVVKPDDTTPIPETEDFELLPLDNGWGDFILFQKLP